MNAGAAYLAGLLTLPTAALGVWAGMLWWRALRRAQGESEPIALTLLPSRPLSQEELGQRPVLSRMRYGGHGPGRRRAVRGTNGRTER